MAVVAALVAAFALAGTVDREEDARHAEWLARSAEAGEWVVL